MNCPSCSSENTQTIKMMVLSGSTNSQSVAAGITSDLTLGAAVVNTNGHTLLASKFTPSDGKDALEAFRRSVGYLTILTMICFLFNIIFGFLVLGGVVLWARRRSEWVSFHSIARRFY